MQKPVFAILGGGRGLRTLRTSLQLTGFSLREHYIELVNSGGSGWGEVILRLRML